MHCTLDHSSTPNSLNTCISQANDLLPLGLRVLRQLVGHVPRRVLQHLRRTASRLGRGDGRRIQRAEGLQRTAGELSAVQRHGF